MTNEKVNSFPYLETEHLSIVSERAPLITCVKRYKMIDALSLKFDRFSFSKYGNEYKL